MNTIHLLLFLICIALIIILFTFRVPYNEKYKHKQLYKNLRYKCKRNVKVTIFKEI